MTNMIVVQAHPIGKDSRFKRFNYSYSFGIKTVVNMIFDNYLDLEMKKLIILVLMVITLAGCGGGGSDAPQPIDVTGTWQGNVTEKSFGKCMFNLVLLQTGTSVTGSYMDINMYGTGSVSGFVSGNVLICSLKPTGCKGTMEGTAVVRANSTGQQQVDFYASGTYTCGDLTFNNTISGILIKQ
jgi:hypothetical protein